MFADAEIKATGFSAWVVALGDVQAEKFSISDPTRAI